MRADASQEIGPIAFPAAGALCAVPAICCAFLAHVALLVTLLATTRRAAARLFGCSLLRQLFELGPPPPLLLLAPFQFCRTQTVETMRWLTLDRTRKNSSQISKTKTVEIIRWLTSLGSLGLCGKHQNPILIEELTALRVHDRRRLICDETCHQSRIASAGQVDNCRRRRSARSCHQSRLSRRRLIWDEICHRSRNCPCWYRHLSLRRREMCQ